MLIFRLAQWFGFTEQKVTAICFVHWYFKFWVFSGTCRQKLTVKWHWLKFFFRPNQFCFYSRQVCDKRLANWTAITDCVNDEWM